MKHCPNCAAPSDGLVPFCWHCGRDAKEPLQAFAPEADASDALPTTAVATPPTDQVISRSSDVEVAPAEVALAAKPAGRRLPYWALACAAVLVGLATMMVIGRKGVDAPAPANTSVAASNNVPAPTPVPVPADPKPMRADPERTIESSPAPTWVGSRRANVGRDGSRTIAFEMAARNDVGVWMKRVQPLLIVRCLARTTEVFVALGSSASIEQQADSHTVHLQFDDAEPVAEPRLFAVLIQVLASVRWYGGVTSSAAR